MMGFTYNNYSGLVDRQLKDDYEKQIKKVSVQSEQYA